MRKLALAKLTPTLAALIWMLTPNTALAHVVNRRFGDFYAGMLHPFAGFEHILPIFAMALLAGQQGAAAGRSVLLAFPLALAAGTAVGMASSALVIVNLINLGSFILLGALVAGAWRLPQTALLGLAILFGMAQGYAGGADVTQEISGSLFLLGGVATSVIVIALGAATVVSLKSSWQNIAVRIVGSWVLAIGIMMLALV